MDATLRDLQLPQEGVPGHRGFWGDCQIHATMREAPSHLFPMSIDSLSFFFFVL